MFLGEIARNWVNDPVEAYDYANGAFYPLPFKVRVSLMDRFLSNFNRPLRRRMIHYPFGVPLPESRTIRIVATGEVYLLGQARTDSDQGDEYHEMAVGHLVTDEGPSSSSGLAEIRRWTPDGPPENPGWATDKAIATRYADIEFRTSLNEADLTEERIQSFLIWMPLSTDLRSHDQVTLHDRDYRVTDTYPDSGFLMARIDREPNYYVDFVLKSQGEKTYDKDQLRYVAAEAEYNVTGILRSDHDYLTWSSDSNDHVLLAVNEEHLPVKPKAGMQVLWDGRTRTIRHVQYFRGERQYKLRCR